MRVSCIEALQTYPVCHLTIREALMRTFTQSLALLAFVAAPCMATPAFAGSPYYDAPEMSQGMASMPNMPRPMMKRQAGVYSCSHRELHTRLEKKDCR